MRVTGTVRERSFSTCADQSDRMEHFYTLPRLVTPPTLVIDGEEFAHLTHVMRKGINDAIRVTDGSGNLYDAIITEISRRSATCTITAHRVQENEPDREVILGAALLKHGTSFDFMVEKATEIGVHTIIPLMTERTIPRRTKVARWQKLALAAMKQSQRCYLPIVRPLTTFQEFIRGADTGSLKLIPHEKVSAPSLRHAIPDDVRRVFIAIGPEGGFTEEEISEALQAGFLSVSLGARRLRAETAAVVAAAEVLL
jgi:16S rRNA (uracil1498-N3)-methyltransferase